MNEEYILMLEDDHDDRFMTENTVSELGYKIPVVFVTYSHELFSTLETKGKPRLIIIDYNSLPDNAVEILKKLKQSEAYSSIPVVVLGESSASKFISECYSLGAGSFIRKPASEKGTREKIDTFFKYWLSVAEV
jgi:two-component system, response regulator